MRGALHLRVLYAGIVVAQVVDQAHRWLRRTALRAWAEWQRMHIRELIRAQNLHIATYGWMCERIEDQIRRRELMRDAAKRHLERA